MKYFITAFITTIFIISAQAQDNSIYKEITENYYQRNKANENYKLIKSEITDLKEGYNYQSDSILLNNVEKLLKKTYSHYNNKSFSQEQREAYKELLPMILDPYFSAQDRLVKKDMTKIKLIFGNILYSIEKNYTKSNEYEIFIIAIDTNNKVINHHLID